MSALGDRFRELAGLIDKDDIGAVGIVACNEGQYEIACMYIDPDGFKITALSLVMLLKQEIEGGLERQVAEQVRERVEESFQDTKNSLN